jgi:phage baseplate assembly protein W
MASDFLGSGWQFPVSLQDGGIARAEGDQSIQQAIWIILGTARGERVMRPEFGCGIYDLVFATNDSTTAGRVERDVRAALVRWEPRIDVQDVEVVSQSDDPSVLLIRIEYRVRSTNNVFNLVYPFYLERTAQ